MSNHSEDKEIMHLKRLIRDTPIEVDLAEKTINRYYSGTNNKKNKRIRQIKLRNKAIVTAASVVAVFALAIGTGFVSPVMASSIKQIPGINTIFQIAGDLGLKTADEKGLAETLDASDSHNNLTLKVPVVVFDGTRVSIGIERETLEQKYLRSNFQEMISDIGLSINGEPISSYAPVNTSNSIDPYTIPGKDNNSAIIQFSDRFNQGGEEFPEKFNLTLNIKVPGIEEPYKIDLPVVENTNDNLVLNPSISRKSGDINLKLEKVEFTPITTAITTRIEIPENLKIATSLPLLGYDILDEKGNKLKLVNGNGWNPTGGNYLIYDSRFEPFNSIPRSITIKTFKYLYKDKNRTQLDLNSNGTPKIEYIPDLEITLPIASK
ncbi:hypothetical protein FHS19_006958 [Paenibacillus rhizosphaerae]|uniref:DUF4179 domain-containing protein n=1 Tax=Paenibacillus rhizosphaerae TaxID=297318 RepID=A0A839U462_9BACL|nr:DUF4179 domain-containing protein [Paenibacillus rhizosphaerae]MBB3132229.1 hypothetical protein [Paenibacillus rhizosphaerae]